MRVRRFWQRSGVLVLGLGLCAWAQGARGRGNARGARGAATANADTASAPAQTVAPPPPAAAPAAAARGRGGRGAAPAGPNDLYDFSAGAGDMQVPHGPAAESQQQITLNGQPVAYTAHAGFLAVNNATTGAPEAQLFYTYYARGGGADRPLIFFVGGGPGEAATWMEMGGFGPKRLDLAADGANLPPYRWSDNPQTLLADADLVFVNPVGTGFSRAETPALNAKFATPLYDAASLGEFVRSFLEQYQRWNSPRILVGEDTGTGRVANLASYLASHELPVNGIVLLSAAQASDATAGDEQYMTLLPSEVMTSWFHKKLASDLQALSAAQIADRARQFASREYLHALYKGDRMTAAERGQVLTDMARLTGLSQSFLANNDLRIPIDRYDAELLRPRHEQIMDSDSRFTGYLHPGGAGRGGRGGFGAAPAPADDAHADLLADAFLAGYEQYLRQDLKFTTPGIFYLQRGGGDPWTAAVSDDVSLASALDHDPHMQIFVGLDYFDLNSPFYATEFTLAHLQAPAAELSHDVTTAYFAAGAMPYTDPTALGALHTDLTQFIHKAAGER